MLELAPLLAGQTFAMILVARLQLLSALWWNVLTSLDQFGTPVFLEGSNWYFRERATQPVGAPATMGMEITLVAGQELLITHLRVGPNNYGGGRTIRAELFDEDANQIMSFMVVQADNQVGDMGARVYDNDASATASSTGLIGYGHPWLVLTHPDTIRITGASLLNTEVLTATIRGKFLSVGDALPTISAIGASVTLTEDYNKLV